MVGIIGLWFWCYLLFVRLGIIGQCFRNYGTLVLGVTDSVQLLWHSGVEHGKVCVALVLRL